jgi:choline-sulfatase
MGRAMVRDDRFKYVHYRDHSCELYDLQQDPEEQRNLAAEPAQAGELARLRALLVEHAMENAAGRATAAEVGPAWHRVHAPQPDESAVAGRGASP